MADKRLEGVLATLCGATAWGFSGACVQNLLSSYYIPSLLLTAIRMSCAGILFLVVLFTTRREETKAMLSDRTTCAQLLVFGVCGLFACQGLYIATVAHTNAGTATVLQGANCIFVLIATCLIERRRPEQLEVIALVCALVATFLIATGGNIGSLSISGTGLGLGIATALSAAFYTMYPRRLLDRWGSFQVTGVGMAVGGLVATCAWFAAGAETGDLFSLGLDGIVMLVVMVFIGTFGAFGLFLHGISLVGGVRGSMLGSAEPVSATLFSALWLSTAFTWADWIGLVLMVATIFLIALQSQVAES